MAKKILTKDEVKIIKHLCAYYVNEYKDIPEEYETTHKMLTRMRVIHAKMEKYEGTGLSEEISDLGEERPSRKRSIRAKGLEEELSLV